MFKSILSIILQPAKIKTILYYSKVKVLLITLFGMILIQIYSLILTNLTLNFTQLLSNQAHTFQLSDPVFLISAILIAPLLEELIFRGPLRLEDKSSGIYFFIITAYLLIGLSATFNSIEALGFLASLGLMLAVLIFFVYSVIALFANVSTQIERLRIKFISFCQGFSSPVYRLINRFPNWAIWYSSFAFLISHSFYANNSSITSALGGLLAVSVTGLPLVSMLVYLRLRYSLSYAILAHSLFNLLSVLVMVYFK